ncbi:hypothetical protein HZS35_05055 [Pantoea brenneri]|uniref:Uncharacterized protein n=1 Tax=Pantoea brenneri TaxID=472694 RepID=A0A7Y6NCA1_9GAMM|nr:hypothetical protein [Pantoea brenneri]HAI04932.1 hypothetical protein [Pantoea sp.]NUY48412.1 hypothetical protein [Pantoea brenneri]NUY58949.1 hypothetical protein [Pantoea brenneri]NUY63395.1 hypothetical protein [Pantoea brenneri]
MTVIIYAAADHRLTELTLKRPSDPVPPSVWHLVRSPLRWCWIGSVVPCTGDCQSQER